MYDPNDCNDLNELRTEVEQQRETTKHLQEDYRNVCTDRTELRQEVTQLREQLQGANTVITEYRQENDAQKESIHNLAERARIAEALNVQGNINFDKLQEDHKIIRDGWMRATSDEPKMQVLIVERKGPNRLVRRKCDYPGALTEMQAMLLYAADWAVSLTTEYYCMSWYIEGKELRIYHDPKDTAHYFQITICAKETKTDE